MASLANTGNGLVASTYGDLLWTNNSNAGVSATLSPIYDGVGNSTGLLLSASAIGTGNISLATNTISATSGNLTVNPFTSGTLNLATLAGVNTVLGNSTGTTTINGAVTFGTAPSFTSLKVTTSILDTNSNTSLGFTATSSAVNYLNITDSATSTSPTLSSLGSDTNIGLNIKPKGTGSINLLDGNGNTILTTTTTASAVNYLNITNDSTGNNPVLTVTGSDTNVSGTLQTKGTGTWNLLAGGSTTNAQLNFVQQSGNGSKFIGLAAPSTIASSKTFVLPSADGSAGQFLKTDGSANLSFAGFSGLSTVTVQKFTSSGTYTPTTGMKYCVVEGVGGGGGGGGASASGANSAGAGGGGAGYFRKMLTAAQVTSGAVVIGTGGAGGTTSTGSTGVATTFTCTGSGSIVLTGNPGVGGNSFASATVGFAQGGVGGTATNGDLNIQGSPGGCCYAPVNSQLGFTGNGGNSILGLGALAAGSSTTGIIAGTAGQVYGSGGSGGGVNGSSSAAGGAGAIGIVIVTEFS